MKEVNAKLKVQCCYSDESISNCPAYEEHEGTCVFRVNGNCMSVYVKTALIENELNW